MKVLLVLPCFSEDVLEQAGHEKFKCVLPLHPQLVMPCSTKESHRPTVIVQPLRLMPPEAIDSCTLLP